MILDVEEIIIMVLSTFVISLILVPLMKKVAIYINALDIPKDERRMHKDNVPKLGGLGIFLSFLFGYIFFGKQSIQMNSILIGSFIIIITGLIDDIKPIKARYKLIGQVVAALLIPLYGNMVLTDISAFGIYINFGIFSIPLTVLFIIGVINCINLSDGLDGLAGGISSIYFITIGIVASLMSNTGGLDVILTFIMLGSTLGFLVYNFYPAKIFMGDTGSMFLGYIISVIALLGYKNITVTSLIIPIFLLAIPILDTAFAIVRRLIKKENIFTPDKQHLHHQIYNMCFSVRTTVICIYIIDILFALVSILYSINNPTLGIILYIFLFILTIWFLIFSNIIRERKKAEEKKKKNIFNKLKRKKK
ncbi:MAG: MraY family glycosyltransferase [bacterium]|nr:MraY family glycosyltransferase [bacterium]